jgi:hypothetical protein
MLELGVSEPYAKLLYWGARLGGPKWEERNVFGNSPKDVQKSARKLGQTISPEQIEERSATIKDRIGAPR